MCMDEKGGILEEKKFGPDLRIRKAREYGKKTSVVFLLYICKTDTVYYERLCIFVLFHLFYITWCLKLNFPSCGVWTSLKLFSILFRCFDFKIAINRGLTFIMFVFQKGFISFKFTR